LRREKSSQPALSHVLRFCTVLIKAVLVIIVHVQYSALAWLGMVGRPPP
jgi:hypothetical protein